MKKNKSKRIDIGKLREKDPLKLTKTETDLLKQYTPYFVPPKRVQFYKVVSRNVFEDIVSGIRNFLGTNLTAYERMLKKAIAQIDEDLKEQSIELKWFRYEISQLTNGAMAVMLYGEQK